MNCPSCGGGTRYVEQYRQHWCEPCQKYAVVPKKGVNLWLVVGLPVAAVMIIIGVLVYQSISSFKSYVNKAQTSEAQQNLRALHYGVQTYFQSEHIPMDSHMVITHQLPRDSAGPTPPLGTCCAQGGKCDPSMELWDQPVWQALDFSMGDPHYYSYEYVAGGDGRSYTVNAYGDLDCDGDFSTYSMHGQISDDDGLISSDAVMIEDGLE